MDSVKKIIEVEKLITAIYADEIHLYGSRPYYAQILKIIYHINLKTWKDKDLICDNETFIEHALGSNINAVTRGLNLPRETVRRKVNELIELDYVMRVDGKLYVTQKYRKTTFEKSVLFHKKMSNLA
ncbi:hypothetical protein [Candidatus Pelagibacter sp.]|uniref:hypothetical protein n=1 Tax=Candidatus Pelagibacter sp. TaxID=2024849 RepID=UPI003F828ED0